MLEERLQKLLSVYGTASRRAAEQLIADGCVFVNGHRARIGDRADPDTDQIVVNGIPLEQPHDRTYLLLNKPRGYVTTLSDEKGRKDVASLVSTCGARVWPVGRLDLDSEGLLLMTNDGDLTYKLTHPSHEVEKEYHVWVEGNLNHGLSILSGPVTLDGIRLKTAKVQVLSQAGNTGVLSLVIHEGKNRQIRRMCAAADLTVTRLKRIREGPIELGSLGLGRWRLLTEEEMTALKTI